MRRDLDRLHDILDAIAAIEKYTTGGRERFDQNELVQVWCLRHIEIIGEASSRLSDELRGRYTAMPWPEIIAMRNLLIHGYFDVDWEEVWSVVEKDLAGLREGVQRILSVEGDASE